MNKQEINVIKRQIEACEQCLEMTKTKLITLREGLAEAEKPKPRHGNFGFGTTTDKWPRLTLESFKGEIFSAGQLSCDTIGGKKQAHPEHVYGNIFTLLKEWGKDFKNVVFKNSFDSRVFLIQKSLLNERDIYLGTEDRGKRMGVYLTKAEAKEIWMALGTAIFELKRKQGKG